jgi:hypothetical protein
MQGFSEPSGIFKRDRDSIVGFSGIFFFLGGEPSVDGGVCLMWNVLT